MLQVDGFVFEDVVSAEDLLGNTENLSRLGENAGSSLMPSAALIHLYLPP